ncbi:glutamate synthase large subunit [Cerasicoccus arenae]|uniref:Glutamate synthase [NADPH] large chain n=1 Tax=Cerasicoccus arenae TaxID=424488 RepID=A0A8J3GE19_9BACT|nr:glutamate synthase large subunit [Cerasicoccus arenae]MBK1856816.1 glutamate synthase large subunit [Cerasicoccus arenae]GHB99681.1 glutamate synthase, large subunit [Cerasicoccus arenae]
MSDASKTPLGWPEPQGLWNPQQEKDSCGVGFIAHLKGKRSHDIIQKTLTMNTHMDHRGASGAEPDSGDGAGIFIQMPDKFLRKQMEKKGVELPPEGQYGAGIVFMSPHPSERDSAMEVFEHVVSEEGQKFLGWRTVPVKSEILGKISGSYEPCMKQIFIGRDPAITDDLAWERKLYIIRRRAVNAIRNNEVNEAKYDVHGNKKSSFPGSEYLYVCSLSGRTMVYKGMLTPCQLSEYFPDLHDPDFESALALMHTRFSTNTFPSWPRAHPNRFIAHNGEINTVMGNVNWMKARQQLCKTKNFPDIQKIFPVINEDGSDSARFDNVLEFMHLGGYDLTHAMMMMIPEPWERHETMSPAKKAFYEFHACMMEPWDGPASITFSDGTMIGASLDRNGLRPSRYYVTTDDLVIMASEVGVIPDLDPLTVIKKGRLQPGRMFVVNMKEGRIVPDEEVKERVYNAKPYEKWLAENRIQIDELPEPKAPKSAVTDGILTRQHAFGYTYEDLRFILGPTATNGVQPIGSMGNDTPLAVLSNQTKHLYSYFKQIFAQVTNPALDCIREELVTATDTFIGSEGNLLQPGPNSCRMIRLASPLIDNDELAKLREIDAEGFKSTTLDALFPADSTGAGLDKAMAALCKAADLAIKEGNNVLIISDRAVSKEMAAIPTLMAMGGLHHHLVRKGTRTRASIVLETGEAREVHHFAVLLGYGADAINPYMAFESLHKMIQDEMLEMDLDKAIYNYLKGSIKGVVKTMAKMGISTVASYRGAQIFEAIGLTSEVVSKYFCGTATRIEGSGIEEIAEETLRRHRKAYPDRHIQEDEIALDPGGVYQWRKDGEYHLFNPKTIHLLQKAVRTSNFATFKEYSNLVNDQSENIATLRGLMKFKEERKPVPLDEVEPIEGIMKRFKTGAMSYGSISKEAHETLAIAMNRIGGKSNTGEGGEDPERFITMENGDSKRSAIKQVASGRFGVTSEYLVNADELQIKISQGAKPGEGGELPGSKVYPWVAKVRHSTPGVGLVSPPPHHDIYSIEDLAELVHDLKNANVHARVNVKLVAEVGVGTIASGVAKGHADVILIAGHDGGTGASPTSSIYNAGAPWELGLAETNQILLLNDLRSRVVLETDGQLKTGRDVAVAVLLGAEEYGFATAPLVSVGCLMMRVCQKNTCPVGVATQDPRLRDKFTGKPEHVVNFMTFIAMELREIMAQLGFRTINEMVGHVECLDTAKAVNHWKAKGVDLTSIFHKPDVDENVGAYCQKAQDHGLDVALDNTHLLTLCKPALDKGDKVKLTLPIVNINRVVGTITGSELTRRHGAKGLPDDTIHLHFQGSAGQSLGAFTPKGMTFELEGDANDYLGKGMSGSKIIVYPPKGSLFKAEENIIIGNVAFYGATEGHAYISGIAGERFCVRNSGVKTVVEGLGDHGCEYMTGGQVIVLGLTGRNFAAGMSGGSAYVYDIDGDFRSRLNADMVNVYELIECTDEEISEVQTQIEKHVEYTGSTRGKEILDGWSDLRSKFVKVMPRDYERMLNCFKKVEEQGLTGDEAAMAAFTENLNDLARVGGN